MDVLVDMGFDHGLAQTALKQCNTIDLALDWLATADQGFYLQGNWIYNGDYEYNGTFQGAVRYRLGLADQDWYILKKNGKWQACGSPVGERCTSFDLMAGQGQISNGIELLPTIESQDYGPLEIVFN